MATYADKTLKAISFIEEVEIVIDNINVAFFKTYNFVYIVHYVNGTDISTVTVFDGTEVLLSTGCEGLDGLENAICEFYYDFDSPKND